MGDLPVFSAKLFLAAPGLPRPILLGGRPCTATCLYLPAFPSVQVNNPRCPSPVACLPHPWPWSLSPQPPILAPPQHPCPCICLLRLPAYASPLTYLFGCQCLRFNAPASLSPCPALPPPLTAASKHPCPRVHIHEPRGDIMAATP